jgi:hypothetical protein
MDTHGHLNVSPHMGIHGLLPEEAPEDDTDDMDMHGHLNVGPHMGIHGLLPEEAPEDAVALS